MGKYKSQLLQLNEKNNKVCDNNECIDGNDSKDDDGVIDYNDIEDNDDNEGNDENDDKLPAERPTISVSELLETSDGYLSEDKESLHNNSLNNSNKATDRTLNYNSHLINTSYYTTSRSTNTCLSTPTSRLLCSTNTRLSMAHNVHPSTPCMLHSTNACSFTSHSNNTNFNDDVFRSNTSNVFHSNTSLNDNTDIRLIFDAFNDDEF
ncbi:1611_t:CDS:2, partial [Funneliformis geosporum]